MTRNARSWRIETAVRLTAAVLPLACLAGSLAGFLAGFLAGSTAHAQSFIRSPSLRIEPRVAVGPRINSNIAGRTSPNIAGRAGVAVNRVGVTAGRPSVSV